MYDICEFWKKRYFSRCSSWLWGQDFTIHGDTWLYIVFIWLGYCCKYYSCILQTRRSYFSVSSLQLSLLASWRKFVLSIDWYSFFFWFRKVLYLYRQSIICCFKCVVLPCLGLTQWPLSGLISHKLGLTTNLSWLWNQAIKPVVDKLETTIWC